MTPLASSWMMIDAEMYGMMPEREDARRAQVAAGEQRDEPEHLAERAALGAAAIFSASFA